MTFGKTAIGKAALPIVAVACFLLSAGLAMAQDGKIDLGKTEFELNCAHCHGLTGEGNGPTAEFLTPHPPALNGLAKANGGVLPVVRIYDAVAGEKKVAGHGTLQMPAFGTAYGLQAGEYFVDVPYDQAAFARGRILVLIEYINRLQQK
jgi:mono/diheme cytochrome c family protein